VNSLQPGLVGEVDRFSGRPVQEALKIGGKLSKSDQTSLPRLNPKFVEWLMGWRKGWLDLTNSESLATE
jgi:ferric-dicitrate binding protein FerR (iron transport regulator)